MAFLHSVGVSSFYLDHRLVPEARAMLLAMMSRVPEGGIQARYAQVVKKLEDAGYSEDSLTSYEADGSLNPVLQSFFDEHVGKYGHSSVLELTGEPGVITEGISWWTAWLLFDSPLCAGQEMSTRAVTRKDWPMAREAQGDPVLEEIHNSWLEVYLEELDLWKEFFSDSKNRARYGLTDNEPFRPALDRARWALPGTIATGVGQAGHLRERARVLSIGKQLVGPDEDRTREVWNEIEETYQKAAPGLAKYGLKDALGRKERIPAHLGFDPTRFPIPADLALIEQQVHASGFAKNAGLLPETIFMTKERNEYLDPSLNRYRVPVALRCSLAVARDWHRHRTFYPMSLLTSGDLVKETYPLAPAKPSDPYVSDSRKRKVEKLAKLSKDKFKQEIDRGNLTKALMALAFGTEMQIESSPGLRDFVYTMELRARARGANFEYREQAQNSLGRFKKTLG